MSRKRIPAAGGDGAELFASVLKDVKPLKSRAGKAVAAARQAPAKALPAPPREVVAVTSADQPKRPQGRPSIRRPVATLPELRPETAAHPDRATAEKMRRGQLAVEASLDLHGMTLARAEPALSAFLAQAQARGLRMVLVVTGKGTRVDRDSGRIAEGAIRREFPHWLNQERNRGRIVAFRAAHARHGGGGAFYVLLKRIRRD